MHGHGHGPGVATVLGASALVTSLDVSDLFIKILGYV
jgi:hypothetical protein